MPKRTRVRSAPVADRAASAPDVSADSTVASTPASVASSPVSVASASPVATTGSSAASSIDEQSSYHEHLICPVCVELPVGVVNQVNRPLCPFYPIAPCSRLARASLVPSSTLARPSLVPRSSLARPLPFFARRSPVTSLARPLRSATMDT